MRELTLAGLFAVLFSAVAFGAPLGEVTPTYTTSDGMVWDTQAEADAHQAELNIRQELREVLLNDVEGSGLSSGEISTVVDSLFASNPEYVNVLTGNGTYDFEPVVEE